MAAIAVYAADPMLRRRLEGDVAAAAPGRAVAAAATPPAIARLLDETGGDVVLAALSPGESERAEWPALAQRAALVVIAEDAETMIDALHAGAGAILPGSAGAQHIAAALAAVALGFKLLPRDMPGLVPEEPSPIGANGEDGGGLLTPRELEVLAALADGTSNKGIARRLGISYHTVKFHVASILDKLDAESRTEAVTQAARLGLVML
jgi:DNA-binding NarL/FixJ family response regulator